MLTMWGQDVVIVVVIIIIVIIIIIITDNYDIFEPKA